MSLQFNVTSRGQLKMDKPATAKILVIDYDRATRDDIVQHLRLSDLDLVIKSAHNPVTGLQTAGQFLPDLIILDLLLPGGVGANYVAELKAEPRLRLAKIIMLTAEDSYANSWQSFDDGVDSFISKPLDLMELTAQVEVLLASKARQPHAPH